MWQQTIHHGFAYVIHVALTNFFDIVKKSNTCQNTCVRSTLFAYLNQALRLWHLPLDFINISEVFNI
jgi:uncharacterized protein YaeQ